MHQHTSAAQNRTSLGIYANTVSPPPTATRKNPPTSREEAIASSRRMRYQLQRAAQGLLPGERVKHCQRSTMSDTGIAVFRSADGAAGFGNLATCGSVWHCPVCAAKITEERRKELQEAINAWAGQGGEVYLMSLTFPHSILQSLAENLERFSDALRKFKNSKPYKRLMGAIGSAGSIRALEVTHGKHGWHPHTHDLIFAKPDQIKLLKELQMVWIEIVIKVGLAERGQINDMLISAFDIQNGDYAAEYVAKFGHEASEKSKAVTNSYWSASNELTKGHAKVGKRLAGRTPFTLLRDYAIGDQEAGELFQEFAREFKGRRQLFWSPKLRPALSLTDEKSDDELAAEELPERSLVKILSHDEWRLVLSRNARCQILEAASQGGAEAIEALLVDLVDRPRTHQGAYSQKGHYSGRWHEVGM